MKKAKHYNNIIAPYPEIKVPRGAVLVMFLKPYLKKNQYTLDTDDKAVVYTEEIADILPEPTLLRRNVWQF